nr:NUMOD1 domain-containing DNA-binding protein [Neisseria meningitidis]
MKENTPPQNQKPVSILDTATGETLTFPSVQAAAKALNTPLRLYTNQARRTFKSRQPCL